MSMFWADELLKNVKGPQVINDSWTPSGMIHMGSLKGPVIHDVLYKILKEKGEEVKFMYGFDDADPVDGLPPDLQESHSQYLGLPLFKAPSPDGKGTFADFYSNKMKKLLDDLDIVPTEIYKTSNLYQKGVFNKAIAFVLDHASEIRKVYEELYKKKIADDWYPLQVICPSCGKIGTTKVTGWDGKEVNFCCEKELVKWAEGCGICEKISPFDGNSKMSWKVEWAAKWWTFGVTIEGAGKDHGSAGGSYDVAMKICKDVFKQKQPLKFVYEFFLSGGKKMSSSRGVGLTGEELLEVLGREASRFLMIKSPPQQAVEFNPFGTDIIPKIYDEYDQAAKEYFRNEETNFARAFILSQPYLVKPLKIDNVRFSQLTKIVQMPNRNTSAFFVVEKDYPGGGDVGSFKYRKKLLDQRKVAAMVWVEKFAPEKDKFLVQKNVPSVAQNLSDQQKEFLKKVSEELDKDWDAEEFQKNLYDWAKEAKLSSKDAFSAIYLSLIGKDHGPKAAWLILSLDKNFVKQRFSQVHYNDTYHYSDK